MSLLYHRETERIRTELDICYEAAEEAETPFAQDYYIFQVFLLAGQVKDLLGRESLRLNRIFLEIDEQRRRVFANFAEALFFLPLIFSRVKNRRYSREG